ARRNWRRWSVIESSSVSGIGHAMPAGSLLLLEYFTLNDLVNERSEAVVLCAKFGDDGINLRPVGLGRWAARAVGQQFFGQGTGELVLVLQQQLLEFVDVLDIRPVRHHVGGVHVRSLLVPHRAAIHDRRLALADAPVVIAPATDDVEALQREPR